MTCLGASNLSVCTSCYPGSYLSGQVCVPQCSANCLLCSNQNNCTRCNIGYTQFAQTLNQTICVPCTLGCATCAQNMPNVCLQCNLGFYMNGNSCTMCPANCRNCDKFGCYYCISGYSRTSTLNCTPTCQLPCATCSSSPTTCTSCIAGYSYNPLNNTCLSQISCQGACSVCPAGYVLQLGICQPCSTTNCQICSSSNLTQCLTCIQGYYFNSSTNQCSPCLSGCTSCVNDKICMTCNPGSTTQIVSSTIQCVLCTSPCSTCQYLADYCLSCSSGYMLVGTTCIQTYNFQFSLSLTTNISTFNLNYYNLVLAISMATMNSTNINIVNIYSIMPVNITQNNFTFACINVTGNV
jgi:proprotein convertase subtilisin/kexin type 5